MWIGHVLRHNGMFRDVIGGRLVGKKSTGIRVRRYKMLDDLTGNDSYEEMIRKAENRIL